jgi:outer membrane protein TolC
MRSRGGLGAATLIGALLFGGEAAGGDAAADAGETAGEERPRRSGGFDLRRCLLLAERNHPNLTAARAVVRQVRAQLTEAYAAPFSQFRAVGGVGLAPTIRGSSVFSPNTDTSLTSSLGVAWRGSIEGVLPLWTFGKIESLWEAADQQVRVKEAALEVERDGVRFDVRRAYYGLLLAREGLALLREAEIRIAEALARLDRQVDADEADPIDLFKMQTFAAELGARRSEAERFERVARAGLRFFTGVDNLDIPDEPLEPAPHRLGALGRYLDAARVHRPEVMMARAGVAARRAQVGLARAKLYPDLGLGLSAGLSTAPEVANQINPFVADGGNYFHYGAALVAQWSLDFVPGMARVAFAEAQLDETLALDRKALGGVAAEVEQAWAEAIDWQKRRDAYLKAAGWAKRWLVTVRQAIDVGTMEDKDLIDPSKSYAEQRYNVLNATMEYNVALAKLAKATGWDAIAPGG